MVMHAPSAGCDPLATSVIVNVPLATMIVLQEVKSDASTWYVDVRAFVANCPVIPEAGSPVPFVNTIADGVPRSGVVSVGEVPNTSGPVPVSSVTALRRLLDEGVVNHVKIPDPAVRGLIAVPVVA